MKQIFRFFRGELNGFYLKALCTFMNLYARTTGMIDELVYQRLFQWLLPDHGTQSRIPMRPQDIFNLGKIGGLFQPRTFAQTSLGSIWFTDREMTNYLQDGALPPGVPAGGALWNGKFRTERGLLHMDYESFVFFRVSQDNFPTDINTLARETLRTTYREKGAVPLGYIKEGIPLFDPEGNVIETNILSEPPDDAAYITWYGLKYLHFKELIDTEMPLDIETYMLLFEAVQRIRRRGVSIISLLEITWLLGEGYITNLEIVQQKWWYNCYYNLDASILLFNRERRYIAWLNTCQMKFKNFNFINRQIGGPSA